MDFSGYPGVATELHYRLEENKQLAQLAMKALAILRRVPTNVRIFLCQESGCLSVFQLIKAGPATDVACTVHYVFRKGKLWANGCLPVAVALPWEIVLVDQIVFSGALRYSLKGYRDILIDESMFGEETHAGRSVQHAQACIDQYDKLNPGQARLTHLRDAHA